MSGRKVPPACRTCREPLWRSTHGFGVCPMDRTIEGGPELMRLRIAGVADDIVRVVRRTPHEITVEFHHGARLKVQTAGVLFEIEQVAAA